MNPYRHLKRAPADHCLERGGMFRVDWDLTAEVPKTGRQVRGPALSPQAFQHLHDDRSAVIVYHRAPDLRAKKRIGLKAWRFWRIILRG